eukprot:scaffold155874_cov39-Prasinocladus_malaysianus.AAC.2
MRMKWLCTWHERLQTPTRHAYPQYHCRCGKRSGRLTVHMDPPATGLGCWMSEAQVCRLYCQQPSIRSEVAD